MKEYLSIFLEILHRGTNVIRRTCFLVSERSGDCDTTTNNEGDSELDDGKKKPELRNHA